MKTFAILTTVVAIQLSQFPVFAGPSGFRPAETKRPAPVRTEVRMSPQGWAQHMHQLQLQALHRQQPSTYRPIQPPPLWRTNQFKPQPSLLLQTNQFNLYPR
jgi:hypothetical protein